MFLALTVYPCNEFVYRIINSLQKIGTCITFKFKYIGIKLQCNLILLILCHIAWSFIDVKGYGHDYGQIYLSLFYVYNVLVRHL